MPRRLVGFCFLIAIFALFSTGRAKADDLFTYQFGGNTFTWQLPASPPIIVPPDSFKPDVFFELSGIPFSENNLPEIFFGTLDFFEAPDQGGGFELFQFGDSNPIVNTTGPQLYMGVGEEGSPTFNLGNFDLNDFNTGAPAGTLMIESVGTPEPSSLLLLGAGVLGLLGFTRKRIIATA